jgi:3-dehydroquinate dehydratase / shikimate dehydrogenase
MVKICISVQATTTASTMEVIRGIEDPDLLELRLDYSTEHLDLPRIRGSTSVPLIATARCASQVGRWCRGEAERLGMLLSAIKAGFDYVDVEAESNFLCKIVEEAHEGDASVIVSRHYLDQAPSLREILVTSCWAKSVGADIVKVVGMAQRPSDNLHCLEYLTQEPGNICFAMGIMGLPSRVLSPLMGAAFTYASTGKGAEVAPGQPTLSSLREIYRLMGVSP